MRNHLHITPATVMHAYNTLPNTHSDCSLARPPAHLPLVRPGIIRGDGLVDQHVEQGANEITPSREPKRPLSDRPLHPRLEFHPKFHLKKRKSGDSGNFRRSNPDPPRSHSRSRKTNSRILGFRVFSLASNHIRVKSELILALRRGKGKRGRLILVFGSSFNLRFFYFHKGEECG